MVTAQFVTLGYHVVSGQFVTLGYHVVSGQFVTLGCHVDWAVCDIGLSY